MGLHLPFPSPLKLPLPRRVLVLALSALVLFLFLHTFAPTALPPLLAPNLPHHEPDASFLSPSKWLPPIFNPDAPERPAEFDEDGMCLFLSPFDALSSAEKARVEFLELEQVSPGLVKARQPLAAVDAVSDLSDEIFAANGTRQSKPAGLTHPILGLLRDGEVKWNNLRNKQSKTIEEAAEVYQRKWGRPTPKGFDLWYGSLVPGHSR